MANIHGCSSSCIVVGGSYVGGLVGYIDGGSARHSYATGSVTATFYAGGFGGTVLNGTIDECFSTGNVTGQNAVGGFVGRISVTCFLGRSLVSMWEGGVKRIDQIREGDEVTSILNEPFASRVKKVTSSEVSEYLVLTFSDGASLEVTGNHPIYVMGGTLVKAHRWRTGMKNASGNSLVKVTTVFEKVLVYDLTVEEPHNYLVNGILVHNK